MSTDRARLLDMLDLIGRIQRHATARAELDDEAKRAAVVYWVAIIGEAAGHVSAGLRNRHPEVPWSAMVGMRNVLIHGYDSVLTERVWAAVVLFPALAAQLRTILEELPE